MKKSGVYTFFNFFEKNIKTIDTDAMAINSEVFLSIEEIPPSLGRGNFKASLPGIEKKVKPAILIANKTVTKIGKPVFMSKS